MSKKVADNVDKGLDKAIARSEKAFIGAIEKLERDILRLLERIETFPDGTIKGPTVTLATVKKIHKQLVQLFLDTYDKEALKHVRRMRGIQALVQKTYKDLDAQAVVFTEVNAEALTILAQQDYLLHKSLSKETQSRIAKAVYEHTLGMGNVRELEKQISGILVGHEDVRGRPLSTYAKTYSQDQIMQFHAVANAALGEQNEVEKWRYVGDRIETSRDFCVRNAGKVRETEEWRRLGINTSWAGKSCSDIFTCRGGYNCRHHFQAIMQ